MRIRRLAVGAVCALLLLGGCATAGQAGSGGASAGPASAGSPESSAVDDSVVGSSGPTTVAGTPVDPSAFLDRLNAAGRTLTSLQGQVTMLAGDRQLVGGTYAATAADGRTTAVTAEMTVSSRDGDIQLTIVVADHKLYLRSDALRAKLGYDNTWLEIAADSTNAQIRELASSLGNVLDGVAPDRFAVAKDAVTAVGEVGPEQRDGMTLEHYQVIVDVRKAAEVTGQQLPAQAPDTLLVEVWLDDQDRPVETSTQTGAQGQQVTARTTVTAFDQPVSISAPDPSEVSTG